MVEAPSRAVWWQIRRWPVWGLPPRALTAVMVVIALAIALTGINLFQATITRAHLIFAGLLTALCIVHTEVLLGIEQIRRRLSRDRVVSTGHNDMTSAWTFAAALLVPPGLSASATFVMLTHLWWRVYRPTGNPAYRALHSRSTSMLACHGAAFVLAVRGTDIAARGIDSFATFQSVLLALLAYLAINTVLVMVTASLVVPNATFTSMLGTADDVALEIATLGLGAALAVILSGPSPWAVCFAIPLLPVLHRAVAIQEMEREAAADEATGMLNSPAWHRVAGRRLAKAARNQQQACLLLLGVNDFNKIVAAYGRDVGDAVLAHVGAALARGARQYRMFGRLADTFALLLITPNVEEVRRVASWLTTEVTLVPLTHRFAVTGQPVTIDGLSASLGEAWFPHDGHSLEELLSTAERTLHAAQRGRSGRPPSEANAGEPPADDLAGSG